MAESMGYYVGFNQTTNRIDMYDLKNIILGPSVHTPEAKLVAYEAYHVKSITSLDVRPLDEQEWKRTPEEFKQFTPVYFVIQVTDQDNNNAIVYVSSNNVDHHYIVK